MSVKAISIIVPVYNAEIYLEECLKSLVNQTVGIEQMELILVDDGSTDNSLQCLMKYEKMYPENVVLVPLGENTGQANARNIGMEYASAPYFAFVDADDWVELDIYEKMLEPANQFQCDMVQCGLVEHIEGLEPRYIGWGGKKSSMPIIENKPFDQNSEFRIGGNIGRTIYQKEWIRKHGFRFKSFSMYEDNYWAGITSYLYKTSYLLSGYYYHYRILENSNSHARNDVRHFERLKVELELLQFYQERGLFDIYYKEIRNRFLEMFYVNMLHIIFGKFDYIPLEKIQEMQQIVKEIYPDYLEYCKESSLFVNPVLTVGFNFPLEVWEDYKKAYLEWIRDGKEEGVVQFYMKMRTVLKL